MPLMSAASASAVNSVALPAKRRLSISCRLPESSATVATWRWPSWVQQAQANAGGLAPISTTIASKSAMTTPWRTPWRRIGVLPPLRLVLDIGIGTVATVCGFGPPLAVGGLVFDRLGSPGHPLLGGGAPGGG